MPAPGATTPLSYCLPPPGGNPVGHGRQGVTDIDAVALALHGERHHFAAYGKRYARHLWLKLSTTMAMHAWGWRPAEPAALEVHAAPREPRALHAQRVRAAEDGAQVRD